MNSRKRPSIRPCPLCGIAMQGSKTRDDSPHFDRFECQHCGAVITETPVTPDEDAG